MRLIDSIHFVKVKDKDRVSWVSSTRQEGILANHNAWLIYRYLFGTINIHQPPCDISLKYAPETDTMILTSADHPIIALAEIYTIHCIFMVRQDCQRLHGFHREQSDPNHRHGPWALLSAMPGSTMHQIHLPAIIAAQCKNLIVRSNS